MKNITGNWEISSILKRLKHILGMVFKQVIKSKTNMRHLNSNLNRINITINYVVWIMQNKQCQLMLLGKHFSLDIALI